MPRKKRKMSGSGDCVTPSGKTVPRKKTGRRGCPKGSRPARRTRRRKKRR